MVGRLRVAVQSTESHVAGAFLHFNKDIGVISHGNIFSPQDTPAEARLHHLITVCRPMVDVGLRIRGVMLTLL